MQVHRVFHDVAALVLRRRENVSRSPPIAAPAVGDSSSIVPPLPAAFMRAVLPAHDPLVDGSGKCLPALSHSHNGEADGTAAAPRV